jgi:glycosyltransferase involved in cell wall biosynthesis
VVIPVYNVDRYLPEAIQSVVEQTLTDWELIVVDDGSRNDISAVVGFFPQVRLIRTPHQGSSVARNVGILETSSEYIAFLDADDIWKPDKLRVQIDEMDRSRDVGLCFTNYDRMDAAGTTLWKECEIDPGSSYSTLLKFKCIQSASAVVVRRSALALSGLFDPLYYRCQDYDLWLKLARLSKVLYIPSSLYLYRTHDSNVSLRYVGGFDACKSVLERRGTIRKCVNA